ncbi:MAG: efflux RND transporter periplasmic adaptor subunit [Geminicoccaceae bacterium]
MLRSLLAIIVVLLVGSASATAYWWLVMLPAQEAGPPGGPGHGGPDGPVPVEAQPVRVGVAETTIDAVGTLISNESVVLRPEVDGRIATINFVEGARVAKGDVLVELDSSVERAELAQAQAQQILARSNFERAKELRRNNAGTQRALDEADAALRTANALVDLAQARLDKRRLVAPFDAWSGLRNVSPGDFVTTDTKIVNLEQTDPLKVDFRVPELFLPALAQGQRITLEIDAYPGESFLGTVRALNPLIDATGRAVVIRAEIANDGGKLRPGLFARVRLTLAERQNAIFVPEQAVQPQGDKAFLFRVVEGGDGKSLAKLTPVELGARRAGEVEVMQGLKAGDVVVDGGLLKIRDGVPVEILPMRGEAAPKIAQDKPATG